MNRSGISSVLIAFALTATVGCVDRRFIVTTNVPAAQVSVDGRAIGPSPADGRYEYAGYYEFRANAPGYEPVTLRHKFEPRWYDYPGLDFFAEVIWPFRIEDVRRVELELQPVRPLTNEDLISKAESMRGRAATLPPPSIANDAILAQPPLGDRPSQVDQTPRPPRPVILPNQ